MLSFSFIAFFVTVQIAQSEVVECPASGSDGQPYCSCPEGVTVCEFTLRLQHRPTFTSFEIGPNGELLTSGAPYVLNSTGYHPAIMGVNRPCLFEGVILINDEDFTSRGCSRPITVDGVSNNYKITINGYSPGPTLVVDYNATIFAHVVNDLFTEEGTSIHWHGMYQRKTPWMDGVGGITQQSIPPRSCFDYIFSAVPTGTHWYHSHVGFQRTDGMFGALVVRERSLPDSGELVPEENGNANIIDNPEEYTLTLFDQQMESFLNLFLVSRALGYSPNMPALQILTGQGTRPTNRGIRADGSDLGPIPFFSGLINGRGRFEDTLAPLSVFTVTTGNYYVFRVVGSIDQFALRFSIDNHTLRAIATDGKGFEFVDVDFISVEAGERYDFLLNASEPVGNYYIRAESVQANSQEGRTELSALAILSYEGSAETLDWTNGYSNVPDSPHVCTPDNKCSVLNCASMILPVSTNMECVNPLDLVPRPRKSPTELPRFPPDCSDCMHFLNFAFDGFTGNGSDGSPHSVNAKSFELPPLAYQTHCGEYDRDNSPDSMVNTCEKNCTDPPEEGCQCINVIPTVSDAVFEEDSAADNLESIVMVFSGFHLLTSHPIHVHGHAFHVVYVGYGTYDNSGIVVEQTTDLTCDTPCTNPGWADGVPPAVMERINATNDRVTTDAIQKDTVVIPAGGYVVIAFNADNPGYWYIHCHIEGHTVGGMIATLQEYPADQHREPPEGINELDFTWSVQEFNDLLESGSTCANASAPMIATSESDDDEFTISRAGFGIALAILILLAIACAILVIVVIILCIKAKNNNPSDKEKFGMTVKS